MLSSSPIKAGGAGVADYFDKLAREDYYTHGGEPPGRWIGQHAEHLGLSGNVQQGELGKALRGFHPHTGEALADNAGDKHHGGYDLTFSAPKSVSAVWAASDQEARKAISECQQRAVESAIAKAERDGTFRTLHGHAGVEKRDYTGGLAAATFEHSTSRNGDPQLHTHAVVANLTPDGRRLDFDTRAKMALGAAYRAELAHELQKMGFTVERDKSSFRIVGVDKQLEKDLSSRRAEILKELKEKGLSGGKASAVATLATREKKGEVDREQLFARAQLTAESYGLTPEKITELRQPLPDHERTPEQIEAQRIPDHEDILRQATEQASTLTPRQLETVVMRESQGKLSLAEAEKYLAELKQSEHLVELRDQDGNTRYTSLEMYELERQLADRAAVMASEKTHAVAQPTLDAALTAKAQQSTARALHNDLYKPEDKRFTAAEREILETVQGMTIAERDAYTAAAPEQYQQLLKDTQGLSDEQRKAFEQLTSSSRMVLLEGTAGTGKSYLLDSCRHAWQQEGYQVIGGALAAKAARGLKNSSGIESRTLHSTLARIESGKILIDNKTVFVIDEAGMAGSRLMSRLQDHVDRVGAKLVIVGDTKQLQPVDAGGAMRAQRDALERAGEKYAVLNEIRRQNTEAERRMVLDAKAGRGQAVVDYLQSEGRLVIHETRADVLKATARETIENMQREVGGQKLSALAMAETKAETYLVNKEARELARGAGMVTGEDAKFSAERGERTFAAGDRVYFLQNNEQLGVDNGSLATVEKAEDGKLSVILDEGGGRVEFSQDQYQHVDWGYCATVHKSQGDTVDNAVYCPNSMADASLGYVALSRHRDTVTVHITTDQLDTLAKRLSTSHAKDTSAAYQKVEKYQGEIDRAETRINAAAAQIEKLEKQIQREREKLEQKIPEPATPAPQKRGQRETSARADNRSPNHQKEQQHEPGNPQPDRYADRAAQRYDAVPGRATDAVNQVSARRLSSESIHELRNLPECDFLSSTRRLDEVPLLSNERHQLADGREKSDYGVRWARDGAARKESEGRAPGGEGSKEGDLSGRSASAVVRTSQREGNSASAARSGEGSESRSQSGIKDRNEGSGVSSTRLDKLEKHLAEAKADLRAAVKDQGRAHDKQAAALARAEREPAQRASNTERSYPKFEPQPKPNTDQAVQRDGDLARRALDAHRAGDRLPEGKKLDKAIKSGELRPTKDSEGRLYFEHTKTGKVYAQDLNKPELRRLDSRNINHALMTKQKFIVVDKRILGLKVGTQVMKSGGTLKTELAGKLRDKLHAATAGKGFGKATARTLTKPVDNALKRGERWQKAGMVESAIVKLQLKVEQKLAERQAIKALEAKVKAAEKPTEKAKEAAKALDKTKAQDKAPDRSREPADPKDKPADRAPHAERDKPAEQINDIAERAGQLANRAPADKSADRAPLRDNAAPTPGGDVADRAAALASREPPTPKDKLAERAPQAERDKPAEQINDIAERAGQLANRAPAEKSADRALLRDNAAPLPPGGNAADCVVALAGREPPTPKDKLAERAPHAERDKPAEQINDIAERAEKLANRTPGDKSADRAPLRDNAAPQTPSGGDVADRAAALASREPPAPAPARAAEVPAPKPDRGLER